MAMKANWIVFNKPHIDIVVMFGWTSVSQDTELVNAIAFDQLDKMYITLENYIRDNVHNEPIKYIKLTVNLPKWFAIDEHYRGVEVAIQNLLSLQKRVCHITLRVDRSLHEIIVES